MHLDIQRALKVDKELRIKYMVHTPRMSGRIGIPLFMVLFLAYILIFSMFHTISFIAIELLPRKYSLIFKIMSMLNPFFLIIGFLSLGSLTRPKALLLLYDNQRPPSFAQTLKLLPLYSRFLLFTPIAIFVLLYSLITGHKRYYFFHLAPFYIIDQNMNPITAIKKTYYLIPDDQLEHLFGMGEFGYADLYRQMHPYKGSN